MSKISAVKRLYIIGNGFDLHYGIKSGYMDFLSYVEQKDPWLFHLLIELLPQGLWKEFEAALGDLEPGVLRRNVFNVIDYDEDSDYAWEQESAALNAHLALIREQFNPNKIEMLFKEWARQIDTSAAYDDGIVFDTQDTAYLTFNYTDTLERAYGANPKKVLHIHGRTDDKKLVIGHAYVDDAGMLPPQPYYEEDQLEEYRCSFISQTTKPVPALIALNLQWFQSLAAVEEVIVLGFGFSEVDMPYIDLVKRIVPKSARWVIYSRHKSGVYENAHVGNAHYVLYPKTSLVGKE